MKTFGLVGEKLGHSFSKPFFETYFTEHKIDARYLNFELAEISEIKNILATYELTGLNVTLPYKESVIPFLDDLSAEARQIGAVNTIQFQNGKTTGHNTDAFGFAQSIKPFLTFQHERALVLGTGGASKAVAYVLENLGVDVLFVSRHPRGDKQFGYNEINEHMVKACKLVVNTTPLGTFPEVQNYPQFPFEHLTEEHLVVDLIYNPETTKFLAESSKNGATILNGYPMLKQQALRAYKIWTGENY